MRDYNYWNMPTCQECGRPADICAADPCLTCLAALLRAEQPAAEPEKA